MIRLFEILRAKGFQIYEDGRLNIIAQRRTPFRLNEFADRLTVAFKVDQKWTSFEFPITTLPGEHYLRKLLNPRGTAILAPGQYVNAYALGLHKGKPALVQVAPVTVYRDGNRDQNFDLVNPESGMFGINIHRAGKFSNFVNSWSAGCQVFRRESDFEFFLDLCRGSRDPWRFTYTLIETNQP